MKPTTHGWIALGIAAALASCGHKAEMAGNPTGLGPFDSRGNYVEAWADSPTQWGTPNDAQLLASAKPGEMQQTVTRPVSVVTPPPALAAHPTSQPVSASRPSSPALQSQSGVTMISNPKPRVASAPVAAAKPKPAPKPTPKPKPPAITSHTVRKGDTLSGLSRRYNVSIATIKKSNGISGSVIRLGQKLRIPR